MAVCSLWGCGGVWRSRALVVDCEMQDFSWIFVEFDSVLVLNLYYIYTGVLHQDIVFE